jgi:tRNA 2-selenouridine synthase SelU
MSVSCHKVTKKSIDFQTFWQKSAIYHHTATIKERFETKTFQNLMAVWQQKLQKKQKLMHG